MKYNLFANYLWLVLNFPHMKIKTILNRFSTLAITAIILIPTNSSAGVVNRSVDGLELTIYELGSNKSKPLYKGVYSIKEEGGKLNQINTITDMSGKVVATEKLTEVKGKFYSYEYHRLNAGEGGDVTLKGNTLYYKYTIQGKTETEDLELPVNYVVGAGLTSHVRGKWNEILAGKEVHIRYGVVDRQDIYRFKLFKIGTGKLNGKDTINVQMMPATWLISKLVKPLYFKFSTDGADVYEIEGRTILLKQVGKKWKPLDGHTVYHHDRHKKQ